MVRNTIHPKREAVLGARFSSTTWKVAVCSVSTTGPIAKTKISAQSGVVVAAEVQTERTDCLRKPRRNLSTNSMC